VHIVVSVVVVVMMVVVVVVGGGSGGGEGRERITERVAQRCVVTPSS
jgi:hypothetical protein